MFPFPRPKTVLTLIVASLGILAGPAASAWAGQWTGYVTTLDPPRIVPFNTADNTTRTPIDLDSPARDIAIAPDGKTVYVLVGHPDRLLPIDAATGTIGDAALLPGPAESLAITPDGSVAYAAVVNSGQVYRIDLHANALSNSITIGHRVWGLAIHPEGGSVFVATGDAGGISQIDLANHAVSRVGATGGNMNGIAFKPDGFTAYATSSAFNAVFPISLSTVAPPQIGSSFGAGTQAGELAITPNGENAVVVNFSQNQVRVLDLAERTGAAVSVGTYPSDVAISPDGRTAYVANKDSGNVTPVELADKTPGSPISIGLNSSPRWIAITPNQPPRAHLSAGVAWSGEPVRLDASASVDSDGSIARYEWDFGDGETTVTTTPVVEHQYPKGSYTATVTLTDDIGCSLDVVFTGQTASCNGSADVATAELALEVTDEPPAPPTPPTPPTPPGPPAPPADTDQGDGDAGAGQPPSQVRRARLAAPRVAPRARRARAGSAARFTLRIRNVGNRPTGRLRVCVQAPRRFVVPTRCRAIRSAGAGRTIAHRVTLRLRRGIPSGKRLPIRFRVNGPGLKPRATRAVIRVR